MKRISFIFLFVSIVLVGFTQTSELDNLIQNGNLNKALELTNALETSVKKYNYLGTINLQKGQYEEAKFNFNKALELHDEYSRPLVAASCYSNIAVSEFAMGNMAKSLEFHFRALDIRKNEAAQGDIAASFNDIGLAYFEMNPDKALDYYEKALAIYEKIYEPNDDRIATAHTNIGIVYGKLEFYGDAINSLEKSLDLRQNKNGDNHQTVAIVLSALGNIYYQMENHSSAIEYQNKALKIYKNAYGNKHPEIANTYNYIGNSLIEQKQYKAAIASFHNAIKANIINFETSDIYSSPEIKANYYNGDLLLISLLQKAQAFETYHFGKTLKYKDLKAALAHVELCDELIDLLRQHKNTEADKINLGNRASEVYESGINISLSVADVSWKKAEFYRKAFYFTEKSKAAVLLDAIAETNAKSFANIPDDLLENEQKLKTEIAYYQQKLASKPEKGKEEAYRKELLQLNTEYEAFSIQLEDKYPDYYNLKYNVGLPSIEDIQTQISENTALLSYFISNAGDWLHIFEVTKKGLKTHNINVGKDFIRSLSGYRNSIYYNVKETYTATAHELYKKLIPKLPSSITQLIIVPAGQLGIIPFEALLTEKPRVENDFSKLPYLVSKYAISMQYSSALLNQSDREMNSEENVCLIAPIEFDNHRLPTLPGTASEVDAISSIFENNQLSSTTFINEEASEINVKSNSISNSKFLHFATHGVVNEDKPELSQIYLASNTSEDGNLFSGEIYNLTLNADLVTLSACQTGLGKIHKGEGIVGLSRALIYSGANNLVVSLWSVADQSTSDLMIDFYTQIVQNQKSYSKALQVAKLNMIKTSTFNAPYYWAPFTYIGK